MPHQDTYQKDRSFLARYGATILRGGIAAIPSALYRYQRELALPPQHVWFISAILSHKWESDLPHPSLHRMAVQTGVSRQQLHNYQRQLTDAGWLLVINRRTAEGGKDTNFYDFTPLFAQLEALVEREQARDSRSGREGNDDVPPLVNPSLPTLVNSGGPSLVKQRLPQIEEAVLEETSNQEASLSKIRKGTRRKLEAEQENERDQLPVAPTSVAGINSVGSLLAQRPHSPGSHADPLPVEPARPARAHAFKPAHQPASAQRRRTNAAASTPVYSEERALILAYIRDYAAEFGDQASLKSSVTRGLRLLERSGENASLKWPQVRGF